MATPPSPNIPAKSLSIQQRFRGLNERAKQRFGRNSELLGDFEEKELKTAATVRTCLTQRKDFVPQCEAASKDYSESVFRLADYNAQLCKSLRNLASEEDDKVLATVLKNIANKQTEVEAMHEKMSYSIDEVLVSQMSEMSHNEAKRIARLLDWERKSKLELDAQTDNLKMSAGTNASAFEKASRKVHAAQDTWSEACSHLQTEVDMGDSEAKILVCLRNMVDSHYTCMAESYTIMQELAPFLKELDEFTSKEESHEDQVA